MIKRNKSKQESMFSKKIKTSINNQKQYKIFSSKQLIGILLIALFSFLFIVSIVQVRFLSTINSYTIGMLFGYYSYFIYIGFITLGLCMVFQIDTRIDKFLSTKFNRKFHFSWLPYLFFCIGVALVVESISKAVKEKTIFPGIEAFNDFFNEWWRSFTNNYGAEGTSWLPNINNAGIIISLFMSLLVCWSGYIISIIIGLIFISHFVYYIMYGSLIKKLRVKAFGDPNKKDVKKEEMEEYKTKIMDLSFEDSSGIVEKPNFELANNIDAKTTTISIDNSETMFPINDPFDGTDEKNQQQRLQNQTNLFNIEENATKEFSLESIEANKSVPNIETFDFELDIFDTQSSMIKEDNKGLTLQTLKNEENKINDKE